MRTGYKRAGFWTPYAQMVGGRVMRKVSVASFVSILPLLAGTTGISASSIISVGLPDQTPSIISAGEVQAEPVEAPATAVLAADNDLITIGNSIVAIGADAIPPSQEEVASVSETTEAEPDRPEWLAEDAALPLRLGD